MTTDQPALEPNLRKLTQEEFIDIITLKDQEKYAEFYGQYKYHKQAIIFKDVAVDSIQLTDGLVVRLPIIIVNGLFEEFRISGGEFQQNFRIAGGEFQQNFWIEGGEFQQNFWIEGGEFQQNFWIEGGEFQQNFWIEGGEFQQNFRIAGGEFQQIFRISGGEFKEGFSISGGEFKSISCQEGFVNHFRVAYLTAKVEFTIHSTFVINQLVFTTTIPKDSLIRLGSQLYALSFTSVQNFGLLVLNGFSFKKQWSHPKDVTSSEQPSAPPQLTIENSDLGKMTFINSDLSGFDLVFKSSKITEVFVTGTKMPRRITTATENNKPDYTQHQLGYSQIKKIYEARGDRIEANWYFALEMEAYRQTLSWRNFGERFILEANRISTFYGQSWLLGLGSTLFITVLFYWWYCDQLGFSLGWSLKGSSGYFPAIASNFLEFLNPIHKADYIAEQLLDKKDEIPNGARAVEGFSRIVIAFFVYQLIQAFRKHGKSSG